MPFTSFEGPNFAFQSLAPERGPLTDQLAAWARRAAAAGRVPCVYLTAVWCPANSKLERALIDTRMQRALRQIEAASLDIDAWADELTAAGISITSVPAFFLLAEDGRPTGAHITGGAWKDDLPENMAPPLAEFFDAPRSARAPTPKPEPAIAAPAPPPAKPSRRGSLGTITIVVGSLLLLVLAAWLTVRKGELDHRNSERERIKNDVRESIERGQRAARGG